MLPTLTLSQRRDLAPWIVDAIRRERVNVLRTEPLRFARECFPHHFTRSPAKMHEEMARLIFNPSPEKGVHAAILQKLPSRTFS